MPSKKLTAGILCALVLSPQLVAAFGLENSVWHFGNGAAIQFDQKFENPQVLPNSAMIVQHSAATVADYTTGELLFYTDGSHVWNAANVKQATLLAEPGTTIKSTMILPQYFPEQYHVLSLGACNDGQGLQISRLTPASKSTLEWSIEPAVWQHPGPFGERLTIVPHCNQHDYWIIVADQFREEFSTFHYSTESASIVDTVYNRFNKLWTNCSGRLSAGGRGNLIATSDGPQITLYNFDNSSGRMLNRRFNKVGESQVYDIEFSPTGTYLYCSIENTSSWDIARFGLKNFAETSAVTLHRSNDLQESAAALQVAQDGAIYFAYNSAEGALGRIRYPDRLREFIDLDPFAVGLGPGVVRRDLPNFIDARNLCGQHFPAVLPDFEIVVNNGATIPCGQICVNIRVEPPLEGLDWKWNMGQGSPQLVTGTDAGLVCFPKSGSYTVGLTFNNGRGVTGINQVLEIPAGAEIPVSINSDITICAGDTIPMFARAPTADSVWWSPEYNLDTAARKVWPRKTSAYVFCAKMYDEDCISCARRIVSVRPAPRIEVEDVIACPGEVIKLCPHIFPESHWYTYQWTPSEGLSNSTLLFPSVQPDTTTTYTVTVTDYYGCTTSASITVFVGERKLEVTADPLIICRGQSTRLRVKGVDTLDVWWTPQSPLDDFERHDPLATPQETTTFVVRADRGMCNDSGSVTVIVEEPLRVNLPDQIHTCFDAELVLDPQIDFAGDPARLRYSWSPPVGLSDPTVLRPQVETRRARTYTLTVFDTLTGCRAEARTNVFIDTRVDAQLQVSDSLLCRGETLRLEASGGEEFKWLVGPGIIDSTAAQQELEVFADSRFVVEVASGDCRDTVEQLIFIHAPPEVEMPPDIKMCLGDAPVSLNVRGSDEYSYRWSPARGLDDPNRKQALAQPRTSTEYSLTVTSPQGCAQTYSLHVHVNSLPTLNHTLSAFDCRELSYTLQINGNYDSLEWQPRQFARQTAPDRLELKPATQAATTLYLRALLGDCEVFDTLVIRRPPLPTLQVVQDQEICRGQAVELWAAGEFIEFNWSPAQTLSGNSGPRVIARPQNSTKYYIEARDANGCLKLDSVLVEVVPDNVIEIAVKSHLDPAEPGELVRVGLVLGSNDAAALASAELAELTVRLNYPAELLAFQPNSLLLAPQLADWSAGVREETSANYLEISLRGIPGSTLGEGLLCEFDAMVLNGPHDTLMIVLTPEFVDLELNCFTSRAAPGFVRLAPVCLSIGRLIQLGTNRYALRTQIRAESLIVEIDAALPGMTKIELFDAGGRLVYSDTVNSPTAQQILYEVPRAVLAHGVYLLHVASGPYKRSVPILLQ